jgi:hypothetical protein
MAQNTHVENEQRVFGGHDFKRTIRRNLGCFFMPPLVPAFDPSDWFSRSLEDEDVLDVGAFLEGSIDNGLGGDRLAATLALVSRNNNSAAAVDDALAQRLCAEPSKDDGVDGSDTRACQKGGNSLPGHGQIDRHGVALAHAKRLEHISDSADLTEELAVADDQTIAGFVRFPNDGRLL